MLNGNNSASVESHEALAQLREAFLRFQGTAQESTGDVRHKLTQPTLEIEEIVQAQRRYVASLESDVSDSDEDGNGGNEAELEVARDKLVELETAQVEAEAIVAEIEAELREFESSLSDLIPRATVFLSDKCGVLNEKSALRLDTVGYSGLGVGEVPPGKDTRTAAAHTSTGNDIPRSIEATQLPEDYHWVSFTDIDVAHELIGVNSPNDFKKVDYATMRSGLERFRNNILPALELARGKSLWDLNAMFREHDRQSGISYEQGLQRIFEAFFSQNDSVYLSRGREESHFRIINGRHRIKAALDAGWTAIPARKKDLRQ